MLFFIFIFKASFRTCKHCSGSLLKAMWIFSRYLGGTLMDRGAAERTPVFKHFLNPLAVTSL